jgi:hypothetical protein
MPLNFGSKDDFEKVVKKMTLAEYKLANKIALSLQRQKFSSLKTS